MRYKKFLKDPLEPLSWMQTLVLTKDPDFFVEPFTCRKQRDRLIVVTEDGKLVIYFHLTDDELYKDLTPLPDRIYLYGACGQITVTQLKSLGNIRRMTDSERTQFVDLIRRRFEGEIVGEPLPQTRHIPKGPTAAEKEEAMRLVVSGNYFRFDPMGFWRSSYERG
jgi:hypothetical protein